MNKKRIQGLDAFRGLAILLMILYHFTYDLNHFNIIMIDMNHNTSFLIFRYTIMSMFLISVGISLALVHQDHIRWKSVLKRILQLGLSSLAVTLSTYLIFPNSWVYFGILHFVLFSSLILLIFIKFPKTTLFITLLIFIGSASNMLHMNALYHFLQAPLTLPYPHTEDLVPLFPWLAVVLTGIMMVQFNLHSKIFNQKLFTINSPLHQILKKMGQHALIIYLIHQPILFGGFELYFRFFSK